MLSGFHSITGSDPPLVSRAAPAGAVVLVLLGEVAAEGAGDVVGRDAEDVDGDAADLRLANALGVAAEALEPFAVFGGDLFDWMHGRFLGHVAGVDCDGDRPGGCGSPSPERSGSTRPTGEPLPASVRARAGGPLTVSSCVVSASFGASPEPVGGGVPPFGTTFGYMNWCVIWSIDGA
jgi:hypothetical protein